MWYEGSHLTGWLAHLNVAASVKYLNVVSDEWLCSHLLHGGRFVYPSNRASVVMFTSDNNIKAKYWQKLALSSLACHRDILVEAKLTMVAGITYRQTSFLS